MTPITAILILTLISGLAMPLGACLASVKLFKKSWLENEYRHAVIAFGGGALLAAVALVLVPEGIERLDIFKSTLCFVLGGYFFMLIDIYMSKIKTSASLLLAMLTDFIPESIALGATYSINKESALLLAFLVFLQNIPEGFAASDELRKTSRFSHKKIITLFILLSLLGPLSGIAGYIWLVHYPEIIAEIMLFAAGGILYSVFQDIAPQVPMRQRWLPPIGAVFGFMLGIVGYMLTVA
ncbi:ZIP family metal transporter [Thalassotalea aquiviva]|uniref:ZIP family metal transporter n=1 Tax=Thalassotalea aquiviva TaxID=3242415 RepID=UPI00352AB33B